MNQKSPKEPKSILMLTMKLLYTYFWKMLPEGALIWLAPIWLIWAQIAQPTSNHVKTLETQKCLFLAPSAPCTQTTHLCLSTLNSREWSLLTKGVSFTTQEQEFFWSVWRVSNTTDAGFRDGHQPVWRGQQESVLIAWGKCICYCGQQTQQDFWSVSRCKNLHETTEHLFGIFGRSRICETDEGTIHGSPGAPLHLKHKMDWSCRLQKRGGMAPLTSFSATSRKELSQQTLSIDISCRWPEKNNPSTQHKKRERTRIYAPSSWGHTYWKSCLEGSCSLELGHPMDFPAVVAWTWNKDDKSVTQSQTVYLAFQVVKVTIMTNSKRRNSNRENPSKSRNYDAKAIPQNTCTHTAHTHDCHHHQVWGGGLSPGHRRLHHRQLYRVNFFSLPSTTYKQTCEPFRAFLDHLHCLLGLSSL